LAFRQTVDQFMGVPSVLAHVFIVTYLCYRRSSGEKLARPSKRNRFLENRISKRGVQGSCDYDIYTPIECLLEVGQQAPREPWTRRADNVD
jgi:hypothetical protein